MKTRLALAVILGGAHVSLAVVKKDANGDGTISNEERGQAYKANIKDYYAYEVPSDATQFILGPAKFYCPNVTVLLSTDKGWQGECNGLAYDSNAKSADECKANCYKDMTCVVWQWSGAKGAPLGPTGATRHCYRGNEFSHCRTSPANTSRTAAERIMHGTTWVVEDLKGVQVLGLRPRELSESDGISTLEDQQKRCKLICQADVYCSVWTFEESAQNKGGCRVEGNGYFETGSSKDSEQAKKVIAGERLGRSCPAPKAEGIATWIIVLACICVAAVLLALAYFIFKKKPPAKTTRAIKTAAATKPQDEEVPLVPLFVPQPTILVPTQSPVMMAPPVIQQVSYAPAAPVQYMQQAPAQQVYYQPVQNQVAEVQQPLMATEAAQTGDVLM